MSNQISTELLLTKDDDMVKVLGRHKSPLYNAFINQYNKGFANYLAGNWEKAKEQLACCLRMIPKDGPTKCIYSFMESFDFKSQDANWEGYRIYADKE